LALTLLALLSESALSAMAQLLGRPSGGGECLLCLLRPLDDETPDWELSGSVCWLDMHEISAKQKQ